MSSDPLGSARLRLFSFADQAAFSLANFLVTLAAARLFRDQDLAGYGLGVSAAVILQSVQRMTLVVPAALLNDSRFSRRAPGLVGQQLMELGAVLALAASALPVVSAFPVYHIAVLAGMSSSLVFMSIDFDRALLLRFGYHSMPMLMSGAYVVCVAGLVVFGWSHRISFAGLLVGQGVFGVLKTCCSVSLTVRPNLRHGLRTVLYNLRRNTGWPTVGTLASTSYVHLPLFILSANGSPLVAAAFVATRTPIQPLLVLIRSLDIVDKLRHGSRSGNSSDVRKHFYQTLRLYGLVSMAFALIASVFAPTLLTILVGPKFAPFWPLLVVWSLVFVLTNAVLPMETVIYSQRNVRSYALVQVGGAVVALLSAAPLIALLGAGGAVLACLGGWVFAIGGAWMLAREAIAL
ncbi:MAG: hypothetical protein JO348_01300 [Alphaproteobacteria bacterium]|nr:hypothetical protein [Alphaproteobacteria bacterium]MBV9418384.1 hypothetical protein [Alphaproteobacteria bacterium]